MVLWSQRDPDAPPPGWRPAGGGSETPRRGVSTSCSKGVPVSRLWSSCAGTAGADLAQIWFPRCGSSCCASGKGGPRRLLLQVLVPLCAGGHLPPDLSDVAGSGGRTKPFARGLLLSSFALPLDRSSGGYPPADGLQPPPIMSSYGPPQVVDAVRGGSLTLPYNSALDLNTGELEAALLLEDRPTTRPLAAAVSLGGERPNGGFGSGSRVVGGPWVRSGGGGGGSSGNGGCGGGVCEERGHGGVSGTENRDGGIGPLAHMGYAGIGRQASGGVSAPGLSYMVGGHYSPPEPLSCAVPSRFGNFAGGSHHHVPRPPQGPTPVVLNGRDDAWGRHPVAPSAASVPLPAAVPAPSPMGTGGAWTPASASYLAYVTPPRRLVAPNQSVPPLVNAAPAASPQTIRRRAAPIAPSPSPPSASSAVPPSSPGQATPSSRTVSDPSTSPRQLSPRLGVAAGRCGGGGGGATGSGALSLQQERRLKNRMSAERYVTRVWGGMEEVRRNGME